MKMMMFRKNRSETRLFAKIKTLEEKQFKRGRAKRYMSIYGGFDVAIRRCLSNMAAYSLGLALHTDLSHQTVTRYEILLRAAMMSWSYHWHCANRVLLQRPGEDLAWCVQLHCLRGDASNAVVWQRCKLRVSEIDSAYITDDILPSSTTMDVHRWKSLRRHSDRGEWDCSGGSCTTG